MKKIQNIPYNTPFKHNGVVAVKHIYYETFNSYRCSVINGNDIVIPHDTEVELLDKPQADVTGLVALVVVEKDQLRDENKHLKQLLAFVVDATDKSINIEVGSSLYKQIKKAL